MPSIFLTAPSLFILQDDLTKIIEDEAENAKKAATNAAKDARKSVEGALSDAKKSVEGAIKK